MPQLTAALINNEMDIVVQMTMILGTLVAGVVVLIGLQQPKHSIDPLFPSTFLPNPFIEPSKYAYEVFVAIYTPIWILIFALIVISKYYETLTPQGYIIICTSLALPFLLQPILLPGGLVGNAKQRSNASPDSNRPLLERYSFKANVWIAVYSFIGNYWYTHYFYSVLHASYTMPNAIRFNHVPIQMYCATHFYFSTYHLFSNCLLRKICTTYQHTWLRNLLFVSVIAVFSYFTAFMETLTISSYPYYTFTDRHMAYTIGSAFYGIYFLVSFPAFYFFDQCIDISAISSLSNNGDTTIGHRNPTSVTSVHQRKAISIGETIVHSCGYGMIILCILDFVRLWLGIPLIVGGVSEP
jgi:cycloeucalenol cycloisomerase